MISHDETVSLIEKAKKGDEGALNTLVEKNAPLVKSLVKHYLLRGAEYDDLFQVGTLGLIKAVRNFDASFNVRFSTYAVPMINGELKRFVRDNNSLKMPRSLKELQQKIRFARQKLSLELSREPGAMDIAKEISVPVDEVLFALESMQAPKSLDEPVFDESGSSLKDVIKDKNEKPSLTDRLALYQCLDQLEEREKKIILLRYFKDMTQTKIADIMGISQVQISRIEARVLEKLKKKLG